jgi:hypothetical protein
MMNTRSLNNYSRWHSVGSMTLAIFTILPVDGRNG